MQLSTTHTRVHFFQEQQVGSSRTVSKLGCWVLRFREAWVMGSRVLKLGCWVLGCRVSFEAWVLGSRVSGLGSRVSGLGSRVSGLGSRVSGFGSWVPGLGFRVSGSGVRGADFGGWIQVEPATLFHGGNVSAFFTALDHIRSL